MDARSIDLVLTSPPFGTMRTFGGHHEYDFEGLAAELYRITKPHGVVCWQEMDQVVGRGQWRGYSGLSWRHAHHFQDLGFLIWDKLSIRTAGFLYPNKIRYKRTLSEVFVLSKGRPKRISLRKDRKNKTAGQTVRFCRVSKGEIAHVEKGVNVSGSVEEYGPRDDVWCYPTVGGCSYQPAIGRHSAKMHEFLCRDLIRTYSSYRDWVCDPFGGVGTTAAMCVREGRHCISWEINPKYQTVGADRIEWEQKSRVENGMQRI